MKNIIYITFGTLLLLVVNSYGQGNNHIGNYSRQEVIEDIKEQLEDQENIVNGYVLTQKEEGDTLLFILSGKRS